MHMNMSIYITRTHCETVEKTTESEKKIVNNLLIEYQIGEEIWK